MAGERPWAKELQMGSSGCPQDSMGHADVGFSSPPFTESQGYGATLGSHNFARCSHRPGLLQSQPWTSLGSRWWCFLCT